MPILHSLLPRTQRDVHPVQRHCDAWVYDIARIQINFHSKYTSCLRVASRKSQEEVVTYFGARAWQRDRLRTSSNKRKHKTVRNNTTISRRYITYHSQLTYQIIFKYLSDGNNDALRALLNNVKKICFLYVSYVKLRSISMYCLCYVDLI